MLVLAGKYTVPVFWDKKTGTIVNNESSEILRFLNSEFQDLAKNPGISFLSSLLLLSPARTSLLQRRTDDLGIGHVRIAQMPKAAKHGG